MRISAINGGYWHSKNNSISVVDSLDAVPCVDVVPSMEGKAILPDVPLITAYIGGDAVAEFFKDNPDDSYLIADGANASMAVYS